MDADAADQNTRPQLLARLLLIAGIALGAFWAFLVAGLVPAMWSIGVTDVVSWTGPTMGTRYNVTVVAGYGDPKDVDELRTLTDQRLAEVNRRMSTYDRESELSRFNASDSTDWFSVSEETTSVVASALGLAADSDGAYDPTVGPVVNLWGFGPGESRTAPPTDEEIATARTRVGYAGIEVRLDPPALRKQNPAAYLDLSSIAKGHGVDAIANLLEEQGASSYMVEIGGEVRTAGVKPGDLPWRIGVERVPGPAASGRRVAHVIELTNRAMATSGDYQNNFEHEGVRYSHTVDPTTGRPVTHNLTTVTVISDTCREADGLATALLVLGPEAGYDWAVERGVAALFVSRSENDQLAEQTTPAWETLTAEPATP